MDEPFKSPRRVTAISTSTSPIIAKEGYDASCQTLSTMRKSVSIQNDLEAPLRDQLQQQIEMIYEMEGIHRTKMQMLSDELQAEKTKSHATHSKYVATQAQVEYVNNLLREANAKIEDFENQHKVTGPESPSPVRFQQRLLEITRERLQLQEDLKQLQDSRYDHANESDVNERHVSG